MTTAITARVAQPLPVAVTAGIQQVTVAVKATVVAGIKGDPGTPGDPGPGLYVGDGPPPEDFHPTVGSYWLDLATRQMSRFDA